MPEFRYAEISKCRDIEMPEYRNADIPIKQKRIMLARIVAHSNSSVRNLACFSVKKS